MWLALASGYGHVEEGDDDDVAGAVLCVDPPRPSPRFLVVALVATAVALAGIVALASIWWPLTVVLGLVLSVAGPVGVVSLILTLARSRSARRRLLEAKPPGSWHLHSFASARPGAGAVLLDRVCDEAERVRRVVYLDTCEGLIGYYRRFGFAPVVTVMMRRDGRPAAVVRMVRALQNSDANQTSEAGSWTAAPEP